MTRRTLSLSPERYAQLQAKRGKMEPQAVELPPIKVTPKGARKYRNEPTMVDGQRLDSKREAKRYRELGLLLKAGEIDYLGRNVRFRLPGGVEYRADFVFGQIEQGSVRSFQVEDSKGVRTQVYNIKAKLMLSEHGIKVEEV